MGGRGHFICNWQGWIRLNAMQCNAMQCNRQGWIRLSAFTECQSATGATCNTWLGPSPSQRPDCICIRIYINVCVVLCISSFAFEFLFAFISQSSCLYIATNSSHHSMITVALNGKSASCICLCLCICDFVCTSGRISLMANLAKKYYGVMCRQTRLPFLDVKMVSSFVTGATGAVLDS